MNEQNAPNDPSAEIPPQGGEPTGGAQTTSTGLDPQLAGLLSYILSPITGLIFYLVEKTHAAVRFHAAQSIVFGVASIVLWVVLRIFENVLFQISWTLGNLFNMITLLIGLGLFIVWIVLLVKGYSGERWKLPVLGDMAERMVSGDSVS